MRILDLFSGNKCVSSIFQEKGYEVITLDYIEKLQPTICIDILKWDYTIYPPNYFDVIWASPDCTSWSLASGGLHRKKISEGLEPKTEVGRIGELLVKKTIEIIKYFNPPVWFIENPRGLLRHYPIMKELPFENIVYYGNHNYPMVKPTNIWSNKELWKEKQPKLDDSYFTTLSNGRKINGYFSSQKKNRSLIPRQLIDKLIEYLEL
jgi:site-specific DNA-cytosine methylase